MRNNLRIYRAIENITQKELADELGISRQTIVAIENDKYDPSLELAFKIAHRFDVKIEDIFISEIKKAFWEFSEDPTGFIRTTTNLCPQRK